MLTESSVIRVYLEVLERYQAVSRVADRDAGGEIVKVRNTLSLGKRVKCGVPFE